MDELSINVKLLFADAKLPVKAYDPDAGFDLFYYAKEDKFKEVKIYPGKRFLCGTACAFELPEGYFGQVVGRSGLAWKNGAAILGGTIDASYRGEVKVILYNTDKESYVKIKHGDRIAQMIIKPIPKATLKVVSELAPSVRDEAGFGSTGK